MWRIVALAALLADGRAAAAAQGDLRVVEAAKRGDAAAVRTLVRQRADVNAAAVDGTTALHWAAHRGDVEVVDLLVGAGGNLNAKNRYGATPLLLACVNDVGAIVDRLLGAGADPNAAMPVEGDTPLMTAARTGNVPILKALLAHGANVHAAERTKGQTALMWAAAENHVGAVRTLLDAGADLRARSTGEGAFTPLLFAVRSGSLDTARLLLESGADPDDELSGGMSALVLAIANAKFAVAALLLDNGADPNAAAQGWTALHQMTWTRRPNTVLTFPVQAARDAIDSLELTRKLLAHGADPNLRLTREPESVYTGRFALNRIGATPFLLASFRLDLPLMRLLLEGGADPLLPNVDNTTPLMAAAGVGFFVEGENPFTAAEAVAAVKLCLDAGADATAADANGDTALHGAAFRGVNEVVRLLVAAGARLDVKNHPVIVKGAPRGENAPQRLLAAQAARDGGWTPWRIAAGVTDIFGLRQKPETAALLRQLMEERGLWHDDMLRALEKAR
jgi:ankyrin repeat protein